MTLHRMSVDGNLSDDGYNLCCLNVYVFVLQTESEKQSWKPVLMVVTAKDLLLYESLPRGKEAWQSPAHTYPLLATR